MCQPIVYQIDFICKCFDNNDVRLTVLSYNNVLLNI